MHVSTTILASIIVVGISSAYPVELDNVPRDLNGQRPIDDIRTHNLYQRNDDESLLTKDQKEKMKQGNPTNIQGPVIKENPADAYNNRKKEEKMQAGLRQSGMLRRGDDESLLTKEQKEKMKQGNPTNIQGPVIKENPADAYNNRKKEQKMQAGLRQSGMLRREVDDEVDQEE